MKCRVLTLLPNAATKRCTNDGGSIGTCEPHVKGGFHPLCILDIHLYDVRSLCAYCGKRNPVRCAWCDERGTERDPVIKTCVSPPVDGYEADICDMHASCADECAKEMTR